MCRIVQGQELAEAQRQEVLETMRVIEVVERHLEELSV